MKKVFLFLVIIAGALGFLMILQSFQTEPQKEPVEKTVDKVEKKWDTNVPAAQYK